MALAALVFPCLLILAGVTAALRRRLQPFSGKTVFAFLGLGLLATILGEIWSMLALRWGLGTVNVHVLYAFLTAAVPEEGFRFLVILYGLARRPRVSLVTAMLLGSLAGLAFAAYEHVGYAVLKGWELWLARSFTSVPYHTLSGAILGYAAAMCLRPRSPKGLIWLGLLIVVHGLGDWPLLDPTEREPASLAEAFVRSGWAGNVISLVVAVVLAVVLGLTGLYFGQQAVISALLLGLLLWIVGTISWRIGARSQHFSPPPLSLWVAFGAFIHLLIWRLWVSVPQLPGPNTPWWATAIYLLLCLKP